MWSRKTSGIIGMAIGGVAFVANVGHVAEQGVVAIAFPVIIFGLGFYYFQKGDAEG
jgi:hypothetical protein